MFYCTNLYLLYVGIVRPGYPHYHRPGLADLNILHSSGDMRSSAATSLPLSHQSGVSRGEVE